MLGVAEQALQNALKPQPSPSRIKVTARVMGSPSPGRAHLHSKPRTKSPSKSDEPTIPVPERKVNEREKRLGRYKRTDFNYIELAIASNAMSSHEDKESFEWMIEAKLEQTSMLWEQQDELDSMAKDMAEMYHKKYTAAEVREEIAAEKVEEYLAKMKESEEIAQENLATLKFGRLSNTKIRHTYLELTKNYHAERENSQKEVDSLKAEVANLTAKLAKERSEKNAATRAAKGKKGYAYVCDECAK